MRHIATRTPEPRAPTSPPTAPPTRAPPPQRHSTHRTAMAARRRRCREPLPPPQRAHLRCDAGWTVTVRSVLFLPPPQRAHLRCDPCAIVSNAAAAATPPSAPISRDGHNTVTAGPASAVPGGCDCTCSPPPQNFRPRSRSLVAYDHQPLGNNHLAHIQQDLAHVCVGCHVVVRLGDVVEGKARVDDRPQRAVVESGQQLGAEPLVGIDLLLDGP